MSLSIGVMTEDPRLTKDLEATIEQSGHRTVCVRSVEEALKQNVDLLFAQWPEGSRLSAFLAGLKLAAAADHPVPVVALIAAGRVTAMRRARAAGATDTLFCPLDAAEVLAEINDVSRTKKSPGFLERARFREIVGDTLMGESPNFLKCLDDLRLAAACDANVLLLGETGTGKEMFARAIHRLSQRANETYVALNFASLPGTLLESELFGHVKGAFTDAKEDRVGRFEIAGSGTLLLDEIGDVEASLQVKLLRVIEERVFQRVGENCDKPFKARLICATSVDLEQAAGEGRFRRDLLGRINQFRIAIPPLRERRMDISLLARHFLAKQKPGGTVRISGSAVEALERFDFPMNVRQLHNAVIEAIARLGDGAMILPKHLPEEITREQVETGKKRGFVVEVPDGLPYEDARSRVCQEVDRRYLVGLLQRHHGNTSRAAEEAGIDRKTFTSRVKEVSDTPEEPSDE